MDKWKFFNELFAFLDDRKFFDNMSKFDNTLSKRELGGLIEKYNKYFLSKKEIKTTIQKMLIELKSLEYEDGNTEWNDESYEYETPQLIDKEDIDEIIEKYEDVFSKITK